MQVKPSAPALLSEGTVIAGRYRLGDLLGRGGMADVYDGLDLRLERAVAVKLLRPEMAARDDVRTRFEAEARAAAGLSHPNAVAVFDTGEHGGVPYLVMERLPGTTLADRIAEGPVDPVWVCGAACGVLGALAVAHEAGIVHRDVKPGNILLATDGTAKIADFGIAKSVSPSDGSTDGHRDLTATGQLLGTPAYLAPERIEGEAASPRSDLWALGVVLYEALTGEKPFTGRTPLDVASAVVSGDYVPLLKRRPDVDPLLASTIERAMARDPERRFATAAGMAAALRGGADATVMSGGGAVRDGTMVLPVLDEQPRRKAGRSPIWARYPWVGWGVLALLVLALIVGTARAERTPPGSVDGSAAPAEQAATSPSPEQYLVKALRDMAAGLSPDEDGARAGELADGLRRVADSLESGSAGAGTQATGLIISAATWHQTGQLTQAATVAAVQALQQVPGVQLQSQAPPTTVAAAAQSGPAVVAPAAPAVGGRATQEGNGNGKAKDDEKGGKDDDKDDD